MTDAEAPAARLGYQPALDGLRGVAVLAVMLFHGQVSWAKGGFLGVDLFFVLSGFLITRLLLEEQLLTQAIQLGRFYVRRALRLFPALALVIVACAIYAEGWLGPDQQHRAWWDLFATATYHMNWRQALTTRGPFGLFDHGWSLSIEEQFYVLWPLVVIVAMRRRVQTVATVALVGALGCAVWRAALWAGDASWSRVYYGFDAHVDGLLLGCALAAFTVIRGVPRRKLALPQWLGPAALTAYLVIMITVELESRWLAYGGWFAVVVLGAVIVADLAQEGWSARVLNRRGLVAVGRISYGLYLWHWPVDLVLNRDRLGTGFWTTLVLRFAVTFAFAIASFVLVERPFLKLKRRIDPAHSPAPPVTIDPRGRDGSPTG